MQVDGILGPKGSKYGGILCEVSIPPSSMGVPPPYDQTITFRFSLFINGQLKLRINLLHRYEFYNFCFVWLLHFPKQNQTIIQKSDIFYSNLLLHFYIYSMTLQF